jgi:hypothetical protein
MGRRIWRAGQFLAGLMSVLMVASCGDSAGPTPPNIDSVAFAVSNVTLSQGEARVLAIAVKNANGAVLTDVQGIQWKSGDPTRLSVTQSGEIRGEALGGPVTVTASIGGLAATATVTVVPARIAFTPADSNLVLGSMLQLSGTMLDYAGAPIGTTAQVAWSSSNPSVATIGSSSGLVTTVSSGETTISATAAGRTSTRTLRVGVSSPYDGRWSGVSAGANPSQGRTLTTSFEVIFGRVYSFELKLSHAFVIASGTQLNCAFTLTAPAPTVSAIANDAFTTTAVPTAGGTSSTVTGTFTSPTTLSGTHTAISFGGGPAVCGMIGSIGFTPVTAVGASTFTASRAQ